MKSPYTNSLAHTTWKRKYHIVFAPKFKRKEMYGILQIENKTNLFAENINKIIEDLITTREIRK